MSDFINQVLPPGSKIAQYDRSKQSSQQPSDVPHAFIEAMSVREEVFVKEQKVPLENELDDDDQRSFHWIAYASVGAPKSPEPKPVDAPITEDITDAERRKSTGSKLAIGTIRIVPWPHPEPGLHHDIETGDNTKGRETSKMYDGKEAYVKLGRLAVLKQFRGMGISNMLMREALAFAKQYPLAMNPKYNPADAETTTQAGSERGAGFMWKGLVLAHAQVGLEKFYNNFSFEKDESMGVWDEEGMDHIGMWTRLQVTGSYHRRVSAVSIH